MKFRVRAGKFTVRDGVEKRVYRKGDVVESDQPLNTIFKNAFETADDLRHRRRAPVEPVVEEDGDKADAQEEPVGKVTLRPVHRGGGRWDERSVSEEGGRGSYGCCWCREPCGGVTDCGHLPTFGG